MLVTIFIMSYITCYHFNYSLFHFKCSFLNTSVCNSYLKITEAQHFCELHPCLFLFLEMTVSQTAGKYIWKWFLVDTYHLWPFLRKGTLLPFFCANQYLFHFLKCTQNWDKTFFWTTRYLLSETDTFGLSPCVTV